MSEDGEKKESGDTSKTQPTEDSKEKPSKEKPTSQGNDSGGRGRGRRGRGGGRGGRGRGNRSRHRATRPVVKTNKFKGNTDGMNSHVFQCHNEEEDKKQFLRTVGVLEQYVNKTFEYPGDVASVYREFDVEELKQPEKPTAEEYKEDFAKKLIYESEMKTYMRRKDRKASNLRAIYAIVWGQCSPMMQSKIESKDEYHLKSKECDCVWLLKEIRAITHQFEDTTIGYVSLFDAWEAFYSYRQGTNQTLHEYLKDYQAMVQVLEHYRAPIGEGEVYNEMEQERITDENEGASDTKILKLTATAAKQRFIAVSFIQCADRKRYGGLWSELKNMYTRGMDQYPNDLTAAYNLLLNYSPNPACTTQSKKHTDEEPEEEISGVSFLQGAGPVAGSDGITRPKIQCYNCQQQGHYADMCPQGEEEGELKTGAQMLQITPTHSNAEVENESGADKATGTDSEADDDDDGTSTDSEHSDAVSDAHDDDDDYKSEFTFLNNATTGISMQQSNRYDIPDTWVLLDSQSTVSVFKNRRYLSNIRRSNKTLKVHTNGGTQVSNQVGRVRNFGEVWYNPESLANILSMAEVRKKCRITMDTSVEAAMIVHRQDGTTMKFKEYETGLYYYDVRVESKKKTKHSSTQSDDYLFLTTVNGNKLKYTRRDVKKAEQARELYRRLGHPGEQAFIDHLKHNRVRNCPITAQDALRAIEIYGPEVGTLQGRTVKQGNQAIPNLDRERVPEPIIIRYRRLRLFVDIFFCKREWFHTHHIGTHSFPHSRTHQEPIEKDIGSGNKGGDKTV